MPVHGFYPDNPKQLNQMINSFMKSSKSKQIPNAKACILPHAGYSFSGSIAMHTLMACHPFNQDKFYIIGPDHCGSGTTNKPAPQEHSIDVQIPLIKSLKPDITNKKIQQKILGNEINFNDLQKLAKEIINNKKDGKQSKNTFYIASSDFIHFGLNYGYEPVQGTIKEQIKWVKDADKELAELIASLKPEEFYNTVEQNNYTVCGYKPITLIILIAKSLGAKQGSIIEHKTSYEILPASSFVDYMGIVLY